MMRTLSKSAVIYIKITHHLTENVQSSRITCSWDEVAFSFLVGFLVIGVFHEMIYMDFLLAGSIHQCLPLPLKSRYPTHSSAIQDRGPRAMSIPQASYALSFWRSR